MSDLSQPPLTLVQATDEIVWPTPALPCYPAPMAAPVPPPCEVEGMNGRALSGRLLGLDPQRGTISVRANGARTPVLLRFDQFRRLRLVDPLLALPTTGHPDHPAAGSPAEATAVPFTVHMNGTEPWTGHSLTPRQEPWGLFLFEPIDGAGTLRRTFVPRPAYQRVDLGAPPEPSASPDPPDRRGGELLNLHQILTADDLHDAIDKQATMPMVRIGEALVALGLISESQLQEALEEQSRDRSAPLGEMLVARGCITRAELQTALARKMGYPLVDVEAFPVDTEAVARLPYPVAARLPALPLVVRGGRLVVALEDPSSRSATDELEFASQMKILPVLARAGTIAMAVEAAYEKMGAEVASQRLAEASAIEFDTGDASRLAASLEASGVPDEDDLGPAIEQSDNSLVRLINSMILEAQTKGASDIHVECPPGREKVRIRFRKDGMLRPYLELPPSYRSAVVARLKIMCDLDISERRKPQDGKIAFSKFSPGSRLELRVATIPTQGNHEDVVLRLLSSGKPLPIDQMGLSPANLERFVQAIQRPHGMVLCVGPTGSGKTTTLHSALSHINTPERKIWTAEDPVEITQPGLRQVQVNAKIDWTFAKALRAFLRADPDVIMVGEIRDRETAQMAIEAALTGHLVFSTLHTNSAAETVTRLLDMGMDPFNFADSLQAVLAQRLVRRLCTHCRVAEPLDDALRDELLADHLHVHGHDERAPAREAVLESWLARFGVDGRLQRWHSPGCDRCDGTGLKGRAALHELMGISRALRQMIQTRAPTDDLLRQALGEGMRTLRQDGIEKVLAGVTSIEEVRASS